MLPRCKTKNEHSGIGQWDNFRNAVTAWRTKKLAIFQSEFGIERVSVDTIKAEMLEIIRALRKKPKVNNRITLTQGEVDAMLNRMLLIRDSKKWERPNASLIH